MHPANWTRSTFRIRDQAERAYSCALLLSLLRCGLLKISSGGLYAPACHAMFAEIRRTAPPDREAAAPRPRSSCPSHAHLFAGVQYLGATAGQPSRAGWRILCEMR